MGLFRDRVALATTAVFLVVISLPYVLAAAWAPPGATFLGSFYNSQDMMVYLSAIRAGARGEWLRTLPYTTEAHQPALYYIYYMALGHLAAPDMLTFHSARIVSALALAAALYALIVQVLSTALERRTAFILGLLGMGVGFIVMLMGFGKAIRPTDIFLPTSSLLSAAIINPHFPLGAAMQLAMLAAYLRARRAPYRTGTLAIGSVACLVLGFLLPYQLFVAGAIMGVDAACEAWRHRRLWTPATRAAFFILLPGAAPLMYYLGLQTIVPFWKELIAQWPVLEHQFSAPDFIAGYGWLLVLAVTGAVHIARRPAGTDAERFLVIWLVVNALLIVAPLDFSDRTSLGFSAVLTMLAAVALARVVGPWLASRAQGARLAARYPRFTHHFPAMLLIGCVPSALLLGLTLALFAVASGDLPYYLAADDAVLITRLAREATPHDAVLAMPAIANLVPALSDARVYAGHTHETYQAERKKAEVQRFFSNGMSDAERRDFLARQGITYVFVQPSAHGAGGYSGTGADFLTVVARAGDATLYRVTGTGR
ncbi:MAG: hypothetical protein HZB53_15700 [Chloroflexi bacterium]|nr:hypothetical protein [Chloroflexota bacterium]